jgi:hypothetical protein
MKEKKIIKEKTENEWTKKIKGVKKKEIFDIFKLDTVKISLLGELATCSLDDMDSYQSFGTACYHHPI